MQSRRPPIYLVTGLIIGIVLGLVYAWVLTPAEALETRPADLRNDFKDAYRDLIARAYLANGDLGRATARLELLEDEDPVRALAVQAQLSLGQGGVNGPARALGLLAAALQAEIDGVPLAIKTPGPIDTDTAPTPTVPDETREAAPTPTSQSLNSSPTPQTAGGETPAVSPTASINPTASHTASPTPGPPFVLLDIQFECNPAISPPRIQVYVTEGAGQPVPGVAILISWDGNTNRFVTGLKPAYGLGYADFDMDPAVTNSMRLEDGGDPINSITGRLCEGSGEPFYGSWRFNFVQP